MNYLICSDLDGFNSLLARINNTLGYPNGSGTLTYAVAVYSFKKDDGSYIMPILGMALPALTESELASLIGYSTAFAQGYLQNTLMPCNLCGACCIVDDPEFWKNQSGSLTPDQINILTPMANNLSGHCQMLYYNLDGTSYCMVQKQFSWKEKPIICQQYQPSSQCPAVDPNNGKLAVKI